MFNLETVKYDVIQNPEPGKENQKRIIIGAKDETGNRHNVYLDLEHDSEQLKDPAILRIYIEKFLVALGHNIIGYNF